MDAWRATVFLTSKILPGVYARTDLLQASFVLPNTTTVDYVLR